MTGSAGTAPDRFQRQPRRCANCGHPFGLVRRRRAGKQYCSVVCMKTGAGTIKSVKAPVRWYQFLRLIRSP
jgi:hypothetical protein